MPGLEFGFLLHDIGKVAVPDAILYKPEALTDEERALMEQHPMIGAEIVGRVEFLSGAVEVVRSHHERWDGTRLPRRAGGRGRSRSPRGCSPSPTCSTRSPPTARTGPRRRFAVARKMITAESGTQFDPRVIEAFNSIEDRVFERIAAEVRAG